MKARNLHMNLLRQDERFSSSPVRLRVMLPVLMFLACLGCLLWWGMLFGQRMLLDSRIRDARGAFEARRAQHDAAVRDLVEARDLQSELEQMEMYRTGRRVYGDMFARLAEVVPERVQLMALEIPPPPAQDLMPPGVRPGMKFTPMPGPTGCTERVGLRLLCRAEKETPVIALMGALEGASFTNVLEIVKNVAPAELSPRVRVTIPQGASGAKGNGLLAFDIEYRCGERRFGK